MYIVTVVPIFEVLGFNKNHVECRQTLGHLRSINPNMINHFANHLSFSKSYMLSVHKAIKISYSYHLRCQGSRNCQKSGANSLLVVWWYTRFGHHFNTTYQYRKFSSIIETYSINFLALKRLNSQILQPIWPFDNNQCWPRGGSDNRYSYFHLMHSEQLWGLTCGKHCCDAFIQMIQVLFRITMYWSSGNNPIFCSAFCQLATTACADPESGYPDGPLDCFPHAHAATQMGHMQSRNISVLWQHIVILIGRWNIPGPCQHTR